MNAIAGKGLRHVCELITLHRHSAPELIVLNKFVPGILIAAGLDDRCFAQHDAGLCDRIEYAERARYVVGLNRIDAIADRPTLRIDDLELAAHDGNLWMRLEKL